MNQSCVSAFARGARVIVLAAVLTGLGAGGLLAQATGKIEGRVRDQAGAPVANAQVFIVGTAFNALTNPQGYYFINNVPAATVTVRAAFVGYRPVQFTDVKILAGQTLTQDFALEQTPVELEVVTIEAENPLVPRDEVTSKQRVDGDFTEALPVDRINAVLALQPGVVASASGNTLSIRGGRVDEGVTYIDGVPVTPGNRNTQNIGSLAISLQNTTISLGTNSFEEASITTGSSSAEFGNAQGGVISQQTRAGGTDYTGSIAYETDEPLGTKYGVGFNRVETSVGGPLPGVAGLTFFASGTLEGQQSNFPGFNAINNPILVPAGVDTTVLVPYEAGVPTVGGSDTTLVDIQKFAIYRGKCELFSNAGAGDTNASGQLSSAVQAIRNNYGDDCQGIRLPAQAQSLSQLQGKLQYTFGTGSRVALTVARSQNNQRVFAYSSVTNPQQFTANLFWNNLATLNWTQNLAKSAERALALDVYLSYQQDRALVGPLTRQAEIDTRDPFGGFYFFSPSDFKFNFQNFPIDKDLIRNYRDNVPGSRRGPYDPENDRVFAPVNQYRNNAYALRDGDADFSESGGPSQTGIQGLRNSMYREDRAVGKANLDWQLDRYNRVKLGGEYTWYDLVNYTVSLGQQLAFSDAFLGEPYRYNLFAEDRLDLGDVVVVGGLRYDFFDSRASHPFLLDTIATSATFNQYIRFPRTSTYRGTAPDGRPLTIFRRAESHDYLSPHIQVSFPVTDRTNFRLSYAHQVQTPDFANIYTGVNTDVIAQTNTNQNFGDDLDYGKTITFEFGIRHAFNDDMVLDIAAYNKDNLANQANRIQPIFDPVTKGNRDIRIMTNADFGNVRGVDLRLDRRFGNYFNGSLAYSFQQAKNTGDDPNTYINFGARVISSLGGNQPPPQGILPTAFSRPHSLAGSAAFTFPGDFREGTTLGTILQDVGIFTTFRYQSGTAYTVCDAGIGDNDVLSGDNCENFFPEPFNSSRLPAFKQFDLRLTKGFGLGGMAFTAYADVRNLFNFHNILQVFVTTKDIVSQEDLNVVLGVDRLSLQTEASQNPGVFDPTDGSVDLRFGGLRASGCDSWLDASGRPSAPNCVYLVRAEQRYGNGNGIYTREEQDAATLAHYNANRLFANGARQAGENAFTGSPRRIRFGVEVSF